MRTPEHKWHEEKKKHDAVRNYIGRNELSKGDQGRLLPWWWRQNKHQLDKEDKLGKGGRTPLEEKTLESP